MRYLGYLYTKNAKTGKKHVFYWRQADRYNSGNIGPKIQTNTFLDAQNAKEHVEQVYFYNGNLQHS